MDTKKGWFLMSAFRVFTKPIVAEAADSGTYVTSVSISTLTAGALTIAAQPDYPRTVRGYLTDANASITGATVTIVGVDQNGVGISDTLTFTAAGAKTTVKAFAHITSATWALVSGTVTGSSDTISLGAGASLGLVAPPGAIYEKLIKAGFDGADDVGTFSKTYGLYTPAGTMNGAKAVEVSYQYWMQIPN